MSGPVRHVVAFTWREGVTPEQVDAVADGLRRLPAVIEQIRDYRFGADLGINEGNADFVVVADFDSVDDYLTYRDHPAHRALVADLLSPVIATRTAVQYAIT